MQNIDLLSEQPLPDLKSYVRVKVLEASETFLTQAFLDEDRRFHSEILDGESPEALPLAASCADLTLGILEAWVAKAYLTGLASTASEDAARRMFGLVRSNLVQTIDGAAWIDNQSRRASTSKIGQTRLLFVADVESKRLDQLALAPGSFRAALVQIATHVNAEGLAEIGHPSSPPELYPNFGGAIYSRNVNALWVSPEIARPPYLDMGRFGPVSFGAFGTLIGHELAHSVSPDGIGYDAAGILRETWSAGARDALNTRLRCFERQLDAARASTKSKMDVHRVLDEHVADLVGVQVALSAMESDTGKSLDSDTRRAWRRDFFIAYAQQECGWSGDIDVPVDDQHAPARTRIDVVMSTLPEFASTFQCAPGTRMAPVDRCSLW
jgi:predicted metalloendopeptidase